MKQHGEPGKKPVDNPELPEPISLKVFYDAKQVQKPSTSKQKKSMVGSRKGKACYEPQMISFWRQLRYLLWKGILIKCRQKLFMVLELLCPIVIFAIIAIVRSTMATTSFPICHYDSKGFPSAGILPFAHSMFCSIANPCRPVPTTGDEGFYINNISARPDGESIVVDFLYTSSNQLEWIGNNPVTFSRLVNDTLLIIELLANLNASSIAAPKIGELFYPHHLRDLNLPITKHSADVLEESWVTPTFYYEVFKMHQHRNDLTMLFSEVPLLCDPKTFDASFILPPGKKLTAEDRKSLCNVNMFDILTLRSSLNISKFLNGRLNDGTKVKLIELAKRASGVYNVIEDQPLFKFILKYMNVNTSEALFKAFFCGQTKQKLSEDFSQETTSHPEKTKLSEMKDTLTQFLLNVQPGHEEHEGQQFCNDVPVRKFGNCSQFAGIMSEKFQPLLQGYILVTPRSPITEKIVEKLNKPLRQVDFLRSLLLEYPGIADSLQNALNNSELALAAQNLLILIRGHQQPIPYPSIVDGIEFLLEHIFGPPSDPYSFGSITKEYVEFINMYTACFMTDRFVFVDNERDMEETAVCLSDYKQYFSGIVLNVTNNATELDDFTAYKIRHLSSMVDSTYSLTDSKRHPQSRRIPYQDLKYLTFGFSFLQEAVERAIIEMKTGSVPEMGMYSQQEPYPCLEMQEFQIAPALGLCMMISFIAPFALLVKNIVYEKEHKLKEQMRIMGLGDSVHLISWAIISLVMNLTCCLAISLILKYGLVFGNTDLSLMFTFLSLFIVSMTALSLLVSTFFSNANISTAATCITIFMLLFPYQLSAMTLNKTWAFFTLLFPPTTFAYGANMLGTADQINTGHWKTIEQIYLGGIEVTMVECLCAFVIDTIILMILAWYINNVFPGVHGIGEKWYFPFTKRYWRRQCDCEPRTISDNHEFDSIPNENFEDEPTDAKMTVHIRGMSKLYDSGTKALNQLHLRLYESQITALLGHNGAGKTTTMSILCGLQSPSEGTADIYGYDIRNELPAVRSVLGVCPQHNVLFPQLTCAEQLRFFAALKGMPEDKIHDEVEAILNSVKLSEKANCLAGQLSGGMKRRLCIGIALIGGSKFVILDEPTAGVDVNSREDIWKLLQKNRNGRTILLSTHHMDEADVLSDRVAVLSEGELVALGSPVYLKNKYGECFQLAACKSDNRDYDPIIQRILESAAEIEGIHLLDENDHEITFSIPLTTDSALLEKFFKAFEAEKDAYGFSDYGVSAPTLQQIFVRLAPRGEYKVPKEYVGVFRMIKKWFRKLRPKTDVEQDETRLISGQSPLSTGQPLSACSSSVSISESDYEFELPPKLEGWALTWTHIKALVACRWHFTARNKKITFFEVILPILMLLSCEFYAFFGTRITPGVVSTSQRPLPLVQGIYGNLTDSYLGVWDQGEESFASGLANALTLSPGLGLRCENNGPELLPMFYDLYPFVDADTKKQRTTDIFEEKCDPTAAYGRFFWNDTDPTYPYNVQSYCSGDSGKWNCSDVNYPFSEIHHIGMNTTDRAWDMSYRNISQMRLISRYRGNSSEEAPFFIGGYSMGHHSLRYKNNFDVAMEIDGWNVLIYSLNYSASSLKINLSAVHDPAPVTRSPFSANITLDDFIAAVLYNMDVEENTKTWFNNKLFPSLPIYTNVLNNALLRMHIMTVNNMTNPDDLGILAIQHPMNSTVQKALDDTVLAKITLFRVVLIILTLSMIPAGFSIFIVEDRISDSFHLQVVSGLKKHIYWWTSLTFDMTIFTLSVIAILCIYMGFQVGQFSHNATYVAAYFLLFWMYGLCSTLWAYIIQRKFSIPALAFVFISIGSFFFGAVTTMTLMIIEDFQSKEGGLSTAYTVCSYLFLVVPQFSLGMAIYRGAAVYTMLSTAITMLTNVNRQDLIPQIPIPSLFEWEIMGMYFVLLALHIILAIFILLVLEFGICAWLRITQNITMRLLEHENPVHDDDVKDEIERVDALVSESDIMTPLVVQRVAKAYNPKMLAVRGVSFAVERGECFGLLGLNGAGKTTIFAMLTGKIRLGDGLIRVNGYSVKKGKPSPGFEQLGYCPQFDALNSQLTTAENLIFYARIHGIPESYIPKLTERLLLALHLRPYATTLTASLSGGNRRKLSVAIALLSQPTLILLDEPSAGMDPGSQQFLWRVIEKLRRMGKAIVMTSHSMEECEALCTRIGIMDAGLMRCLGSKQHLKTKFGHGYQLTMKLKSFFVACKVASRVDTLLTGSRLKAIHCSTAFFLVRRSSTTIAEMLCCVNTIKSEFEVEDFSLSQATLNDVFQSLKFRRPTVPAEEEPSQRNDDQAQSS